MVGWMDEDRFWRLADELVASNRLVIDRPKGSIHPRFPGSPPYPLDYGYLEGTRAPDGGGVDVWRGSLPEARVTAIIATVDLLGRDAEVKLLVGCTPAEAERALVAHREGSQGALLLTRPSA